MIVRPFVLVCQYDRSCYLDEVPKSKSRRPQGEKTHQAIVSAAARLASIEGINGLTIGRLANELQVSKSGLYAHFDSKLDLQLETVQEAIRVFVEEVMSRTSEAPPGVSKVRAFAEAYLSYVERRVFPGGCFFAGLVPEVDAQTGPLHDALVQMIQMWGVFMEQNIAEGQRLGEIDAKGEPAQMSFEIVAALELGNYYFMLFDDRSYIRRAQVAIERVLSFS